MGRPKEINDGIRLSLVISRDQAEQIRKMSLRMSAQEGRTVTISETIRQALEKCYPLPSKQMELF